MPPSEYALSYIKDSFQEMFLKAKMNNLDECKLKYDCPNSPIPIFNLSKNLLFYADEKVYYESKPDFNAQTSKPIAWMNMNLELITRREYRCILLPASLFDSPIK